MSTWYVNTEWPEFWAVDGGPVTLVDCSEVSASLTIDARDVLSGPDVETLLPGGLALWPRGAAWGTPDGEAPSTQSVIANLTRALLAPFGDLYARAWRLVDEACTSTLVDSLDDWERDYGLPDPCVTEPQTIEQRKNSLAARVMRLATITPADVVKLAARLGYVVALEEPDAFRVGESSCSDLDELSDAALDQQFVIHIYDAPIRQFECGIGEVGVTRLLDFDHGALECAIRKISPAWTYPVFSNAELPIGYRLVTETGAVIVTETGRALIAPVMP